MAQATLRSRLMTERKVRAWPWPLALRALYLAPWRRAESHSAPSDAVLEYPCDGLLTHIGSLLRSRYRLERIEKPVCTDVIGKLQHLWIIAPQLVPEAAGATAVLNLELLINARPFPELDDDMLGDGELTKCPHVCPEAACQHVSFTAIVFGPWDRVVSLRSTLRVPAPLPCYEPQEERTGI